MQSFAFKCCRVLMTVAHMLCLFCFGFFFVTYVFCFSKRCSFQGAVESRIAVQELSQRVVGTRNANKRSSLVAALN